METLLSAIPSRYGFHAFLTLAPWQRQPLTDTPVGQWSADFGVGDGRHVQSILAQRGAWRVLCHRDVSALKARELSLEAERARAVRADRAKSTFLATMSHEQHAAERHHGVLRSNPGWSCHRCPRIANYAGDIHQSAAHLLAIINDILDIARIENAEIVLHRGPIPMVDLIAETARISSGQARRLGVTVHAKGGEDWPLVIGDRTRLAQSICNFLSNAIKVSQSGQIVEMVARLSEEGRYLLTIADNGPGIPPERLPDLFRPLPPR